MAFLCKCNNYTHTNYLKVDVKPILVPYCSSMISKANCVPILHRFWDIARYWSKVANFNRLLLYLLSPFGPTLLYFAEVSGISKLSVPGLSYGVLCVILGLAILVELRLVTNGRTDVRTGRPSSITPRNDSIYHASIASRGKKVLPTCVLASAVR